MTLLQSSLNSQPDLSSCHFFHNSVDHYSATAAATTTIYDPEFPSLMTNLYVGVVGFLRSRIGIAFPFQLAILASRRILKSCYY